MSEVMRDMVELGLLQMTPDPEDRRAKLVRYTDAGRVVARPGLLHLGELEELGDDDEATRRVLERMVIMLDEDGED